LPAWATHRSTVAYGLFAYLLTGSLPGIMIGSDIGIKLTDYVVRPELAGMLMMIGLRFAVS